MITLKDLEVDTLEAETMMSPKISADTINGITSTEFNCLKGVKSNIQTQLDKLKKDSKAVLDGWK